MPRSPGVPTPDALEARIAELRAAVRRAMATGDRRAARDLRAELRTAEQQWDDAVLGETGLSTPLNDIPGGAALIGPALENEASGRGEERVLQSVDLQSVGAAGHRGHRAEPERPARGEVEDPGEPGHRRRGRAKGGGRRESAPRGLLPVREQVHQALTLLGAPAAPKLIGSVYAAFFPGEIPATRLTSLRRDEERSFRTAPYARPYYLCAALTADLLSPARGLLTVSTWPLEQRIVGPLSPRTDFLTSAIRLAEHAARGTASPDVQRLLWRFASNIPGAAAGTVGTVDPAALIEAARAELEVHLESDRRRREAAAGRARDGLDDAERLFGSRLRALHTTRRTATGDTAAGSSATGNSATGNSAAGRGATNGERKQRER